MSGEVMLRGLVLVLFSPVIVAAVAYDPGFSFLSLILLQDLLTAGLQVRPTRQA